MGLTVGAARRLWAELQIPVAAGLSDAELHRVERRHGLTFNPDHRAALQAGLPQGPRWPDWRDGDPDELHELLTVPVTGILFDVTENDFWWPDWGRRPSRPDAARKIAARELARAPQLVPVYGHRFTPADDPGPRSPARQSPPVFSVVQSDVIVYGNDLADYLHHEFAGADRPAHAHPQPAPGVPFWSELAADG